jgi:hypothetical protein
MKRFTLFCVFALYLARIATGAPARFYVNDGFVNATNPPVIDAVNFVNNGEFDVFTITPFRTSSTLNFTNRGTMNGSPGFDFRTFPASVGQVRIANSFYNANNSVINCSGLFATTFGTLTVGNLTGTSQLNVGATNIFNPGTITMDASSLLRLNGDNLNLSRGEITMNNSFSFFGSIFNGGFFFNSGILDGYWGTGSGANGNIFFPGGFFNNPPFFTPASAINFRNYQPGIQQLVLNPNTTTVYVNDQFLDPSTRFVQAVYLDNTNSAFTTSVYFDPSGIGVQWEWTNIDFVTGVLTNNFLNLVDTLAEPENGPAPVNLLIDGAFGTKPTYIPSNYSFNYPGIDFGQFLLPATAGLPAGTFFNVLTTNTYTAYEAIFSAATVLPGDAIRSDVTNLQGRIEIIARKNLDLTLSRITALNSLILQATNNFAGNKGGKTEAPFYEISLRATNGSLTISNLVPETLPHLQGTCDLWSGRWTNIVAGVSNIYHVLVVQSHLSPTTKPIIQNLNLRSAKDLVISDQLRVTRGTLLTATNITFTTNTDGARSTVGSLTLMSETNLWSSDTPRCQNLTNWGHITTLNSVFFGGSRGSPFYNRTFDEAYLSFVNHGGMTNRGCTIWARHFENNGIFQAGTGAIKLRSAVNASLNSGAFLAVTNDILIAAENLTITNHPVFAGSSLDLYITNSITDGGGTNNGNIFNAGDGFSLWVKPETGDLLSTTVTNSAPFFRETQNYWAGKDRGADTSGFSNNVAIGHLVLTGTNRSSFHYIAVGDSNAMYVDLLELQGSMANVMFDGTGYDVTGLNIDDNFTIYYSDLMINGQSQAAHLNGANHGHLVWINAYAGNFSTVTLSWTNSSGTVYYYKMNSALRYDCNTDSDNDGIVNCIDPTPLGDPPDAVLTQSFSKELVNLSVAIATKPSPTAVVSWNAPRNSTNFLYARNSYMDTNWVTVTNFVYRGPSGRLTVKDPVKGNTHRFYRVRVDPPAKK